MTKEEILKMINQVTISLAKIESSMVETTEPLAKEFDMEAKAVIADLFPGFRDKDFNLYAIPLGMQIVDDEAKQTFINAYNFFSMVSKHDVLPMIYPTHWQKPFEAPSVGELMQAFGGKLEGIGHRSLL